MGTQEYNMTKYVDRIRQKALFLEKRVFEVVEISEYSIKYKNNQNCGVVIFFGRYSEAPDVYIRFEGGQILIPEQYSLGWFRNLRSFQLGVKNIFRKTDEKADKLEVIYSLIEYLEENFEDVTNVAFCRNAQNKINENFEKGIW